MTPAEIAELRRLCEAATPGPYSVRHGRDQASDVYTVLDGNDMWVADCGNAPQDAAFIAAARTALPAALDEVERLRGVWDRGVAEMTKATYAQVSLVTNRLHETEADRDRLRALLREAVEIARDERWTSRPPEVRMAQLARLAALASEGGV